MAIIDARMTQSGLIYQKAQSKDLQAKKLALKMSLLSWNLC